MSARGRGPDSTLVHMSPREVEGLQKLAVANGTTLTINPDTGLPEAFSLQDLLPTLIGGAATYLTGGAITPLMAALGTGAVTALTSKDLGKGLMAGLGAYGGAGIVSGLAGFGAEALGSEAATAALPSGISPLSEQAASYEIGQAAANKAAQTGASYADKFGAGISKAMSDPMGAANAVGGGSTIAGLTKVAGAISPLLAGETGNTVQTVTPRQSTAVIRPYRYDNMSQTFEEGTPYAAAKGGLMGLAHGGAVRRFDEGGISLDTMYKNVLGREADTGGREFWASQFGDKVDDTELAAFRQSALGGTSTADKAAAQSFGAPASTTGQGFAAAAPQTPVAQDFGGQGAIGNNLTNMAPVRDAQADEAAFTAAGNAAKNTGIAALANTTGAGNTDYIPISQLDNLYMQELSRHGEYGTDGKEGGMEFWKRTFGDYIDPTELAGFRKEAAKELAAREKATRSDVVTDLTTADTAYVKPGVGGPTGAGQEGGGTVVNPNGTITTSPRIPGIPVGGFTGMDQARTAYTTGGGSLGYTSPTYTATTFADKYKNTGYQKEMYDYLMGKGDKPTQMKNADGTFREIMRPYKEATLGVPGSTNKRLTWDKTKGEYFRNPDYVRTARAPILDAAGKPKRDADGNYQYNTTTYKSINQAKAGIADNKLTKDSGSSLFDWATQNNVDEQTVADALGIPLQNVLGIFAKARSAATVKDKVNGKNGGLMSLASGGMAYDNGGSVKPDFTNSKGEVFLWDWENGEYRPKEIIENGKTYTWDKILNRYKLAGAGTGIASLVDGGSPAGGENPAKTTPDWGTALSIGQTLSDLGLTSIGDSLQADARMGINSQTGAYSAEAQAQRAAEAAAMAAQTANAAEVAARAVAEKTEALQADDSYDRLADNAAFSPISAVSTPVSQSNVVARDSYPAESGNVPEGSDGGGYGGLGGAYSGGSSDPALNAKGGYIGHYAQGGLGSLGGYSDGGRLLRGPGDGVSDNIPATIGRGRQPARLADGEFVVPARIVSELGNGSTEAGARALYKMMDRIQANRRKTTGKNSVAVDSKAHKYLPA